MEKDNKAHEGIDKPHLNVKVEDPRLKEEPEAELLEDDVGGSPTNLEKRLGRLSGSTNVERRREQKY